MNKAARFGATVLIAVTSVAASAAGKPTTKMYQWTDDQGVVHVGDAVPPEYAGKDRTILNRTGMPVGNQQGTLTAEQKEQQKAAAAKAEDERKKATAARMHDQMLLDTYLSVSEIEALRDRRLELMTSQIKVTEAYLEYLRARQQKLKTEAKDFRPYSSDPKAPPIDDKLAAELADTMNSIVLYDKNLTDARQKQNALLAQFDADIARFKELKASQANAAK